MQPWRREEEQVSALEDELPPPEREGSLTLAPSTVVEERIDEDGERVDEDGCVRELLP